MIKIIAGRLKGRQVRTIESSKLRPTSGFAREAVFNVLSHGDFADILQGAHVLDLFGGTGIMAFEALSRGAEKAVIVEVDVAHLKVAKMNAAYMKEDSNIRFIQADACGMLPIRDTYNLVFIDPPYRSGLAPKALSNVDKQGILTDDAVIVIEIAKKESFTPPEGYTVYMDRPYSAARVIILYKEGGGREM